MKNKLKYAFIFCIIVISTHLFVSFVLWDLNPSHWNEATRFMSLFTGVSVSILAVGDKKTP